ncbi:glutaredoxin family protein [Haliangium ochraceum]|uniref:Glutaredoxin n=1 Tax=Haliangium ochraceum (strain DSM 14365 / JCM 11303 / SMP-2) TaxID=502025 RepID=D0LXN4_HALO1|nr:glutaredoxin domain-containing protein [Haliangium ochraceum]ACY17789.1 glutaredoxin [Haliangium ochraceum DSM 14365]
MPPTLSLYHKPTCSYCVQVRTAAERLGIDLELHDIGADPARRDELEAATGRPRVPVLRIDGPEGTRYLPESLEIIRYLRDIAGRPDRFPGWLDRAMPAAWFAGWGLVIAGLIFDGGVGMLLFGVGIAAVVGVAARRFTSAAIRPGDSG